RAPQRGAASRQGAPGLRPRPQDRRDPRQEALLAVIEAAGPMPLRCGFWIGRLGVAALFISHIMSGISLGASNGDPLVDSEVRALVRVDRARVLVTVRVAEAGDQAKRADAIARAQDSVLARLPSGHASLVRRYESIPLLALEIDATALRALEAMANL